MKKYILFVFIVFCSLDTFSQMGSPSRTASLHFKEPFVDLGEIKEGEVVNHFFEFESISNDTVEITVNSVTTGVIPICEKKIISFGEKGRVGFNFHTKGRPGVSTIYIYVTIKDKLQERYSLGFKANVIPEK